MTGLYDRPENALTVREVSKRYGRTVALASVNLNVKKGAMFALLGPNGAGKSTLIDIMCTIATPDQGSVLIEGNDIAKSPQRARRSIGVVFQGPTLDTRLTVGENLSFHGKVYQMGRRDRIERAHEMLELVGLDDRVETIVSQLSSGTRRRLEIARALMHRPRILFLDEPTVGLDAQSRANVWAVLERIRRENGVTIVVTTHYVDEVDGCDHIAIIDKHAIIAEGSPDELKAQYGKVLVRAEPDTTSLAKDLAARFGAAFSQQGDRLVVALESHAAATALVNEIASQCRAISIDRPGLESVYLQLTGRQLRDGPPRIRYGRHA